MYAKFEKIVWNAPCFLQISEFSYFRRALLQKGAKTGSQTFSALTAS
jgi:hypothetical protein